MPKISTLPSATQAGSSDEVPIVQGGVTKRLELGLLVPAGVIMDYAGTAAPAGYLLCFGQTLNAVTNPEYQALYDAIGNTYGGTNNTDFVVPDARGRVIAGQDDMGGASANRLTGLSGGVDGDVLGGSGGAETHTLAESEIPSHTHGQKVTANAGSGGTGIRQDYDADGSGFAQYNQGISTYATGGGGAHNNVQPTIIMNKIIKY